MPAKPLTSGQLAEAAALKAAFQAWQRRRREAGKEWSQDWCSEQLGFGQSAVNQYLNGKIPLNPEAATKFAALIGQDVATFSPRVDGEIRALSRGTSALPGETELAVKGGQAAKTAYLPGFEALSIPVLSNAGSMGAGSEQLHDEVVVGRLTVSPQWVARTIKPTALENLRFIHGYGDSMEPTFIDGDVLLVDVGVQDPKIDGVYVLEANDRIYIKRVRQRMDGAFEISSDNPTVKTVDVLDGTAPVAVRGRVVWAWNGKKM